LNSNHNGTSFSSRDLAAIAAGNAAGGIRLANALNISELSDTERLSFASKLFSLFSLQKLTLACFITIVYNSESITNFIGDFKNIYIFLIFTFLLLIILFLVHSAMGTIRRSLKIRNWHLV
jgi:FtsH-binding integral membrane protein